MITKPDCELWVHVNRQLVTKTISELQYEECFNPVKRSGTYVLLLESGVEYSFKAWVTLWGQLRVDSDTVFRNGDPVVCAGQFYIDAKSELELTDIVLGNLLEECAQTLAGDMQSWRAKQNISADILALMDIDCMQPYLDGHPKAVLNKGRLGWGLDELEKYAPEFSEPVQLRWLAVRRGLAKVGAMDSHALYEVVRSSMGDDDWIMQTSLIENLGLDFDNWVYIPVHPWQWSHVIRIQYQAWLNCGDLVDLGVRGYKFLPLQSIRTLANIDRPSNPNIKLPISILNTSCYRGIPGKYIEIGAALSTWLSDLCERDPLLFDRKAIVLGETVGVHLPHDLYKQVDGAPYRYSETLGVIWRDSVQSKLRGGERALLVAALLQKDNQGETIVQSLIEESQLSPEAWFEAYCNAVVIPLYHLLCCYGVGLVAHGQNVTLVVENGIPKRVAIKDLQGDLRIVDQAFPELHSMPENIRNVLTKLPPEYLVHDLLTGHFVTVLRYLSALMDEKGLLIETIFYRILGYVLYEYQQDYPQLQHRFSQFGLFDVMIKKVCINRVRFMQGYDDQQERPLPILGTDIENPIVKAMRCKSEELSL